MIFRAAFHAEALPRQGEIRNWATKIESADWVIPGERHLLDWTADEQETKFRGTNFQIMDVSFDVSAGGQGPGSKSYQCKIKLMEMTV